jgi:hypothetical protein
MPSGRHSSVVALVVTAVGVSEDGDRPQELFERGDLE